MPVLDQEKTRRHKLLEFAKGRPEYSKALKIWQHLEYGWQEYRSRPAEANCVHLVSTRAAALPDKPRFLHSLMPRVRPQAILYSSVYHNWSTTLLLNLAQLQWKLNTKL